MQKTCTTKQQVLPSKQTLSLAKAEATMISFREHGIKTKARKSEYQRLKSELTKLYNTNKQFVTEFEKTNYNYLALMRSTNGFYKLFDNSALFYTYHVAPKLNLSANLRPDGDFTCKSALGFVSVRHPKKIAEAMQTIGIKQLKTKDRTDNFLFFKLPWTFTEEQIIALTEEHHFRMQKFNHVVMVDNIIPVLFLQLEELLKTIYENVRGMGGPVEREAFGYKLIHVITEMNHLYLELTNGQIDKLSCLKLLRKKLQFVKYQVKLIADLKIWQPKTCVRIAEIIIKTQDIISREERNK